MYVFKTSSPRSRANRRLVGFLKEGNFVFNQTADAHDKSKRQETLMAPTQNY